MTFANIYNLKYIRRSNWGLIHKGLKQYYNFCANKIVCKYKLQQGLIKANQETSAMLKHNLSSQRSMIICKMLLPFASPQVPRWFRETAESEHRADGPRHPIPLGAGQRLSRPCLYVWRCQGNAWLGCIKQQLIMRPIIVWFLICFS